MKWFAGISILLNITLAVMWLQLGRQSEGLSPEPGRVPDRIVTRTIFRTNYVDEIANARFEIPKFSWSMVESDSFEQYMFNLRRLECPEWLLKEIILAELAAFYDEREAELSRSRPTMYWSTHRERRAEERDYERASWSLAQEEYDVMKQLVGCFRAEDSEELLWEEEVFFLLFSQMSYVQGLNLSSELMFQHERKEMLNDLRKGFLTPSDIAQLKQGYRDMKVIGANLVSSAVFDEFWLRIQMIMGSLSDQFEVPGIQLSGYQLRELIRIRSSFIDPIEREFVGLDEPKGRELNDLNLLVADEIASSLGPRKAEEYSRSQNLAFRQIHEFTTEQNLSEETAVAVFDVRQTAIDHVRQLMTDPTYDGSAKSELRQLIQIEIEETLRDTLGSSVYPTYRENQGVWIDRVGGAVPAGDAAAGGRR